MGLQGSGEQHHAVQSRKRTVYNAGAAKQIDMAQAPNAIGGVVVGKLHAKEVGRGCTAKHGTGNNVSPGSFRGLGIVSTFYGMHVRYWSPVHDAALVPLIRV